MRGIEGGRYLVAGGGSGIGEATAIRLVEEGASVVIADRDGDAARRVATQLGFRAEWHTYEQRDPDSITRLFRSVTASEPLRGVAIVAGVHPGSIGLADINQPSFDHVFAINVFGVLRLVQLAVASVAGDPRASIVVMGSVAGLRPERFDALYASSKAAAQAIVRSAALEFAAGGVRINSVLPGSVVTPLSLSQSPRDHIERDAARILPIGRPADAAEVAGATVFLLSEDASHITGTELIVDGGLFANSP